METNVFKDVLNKDEKILQIIKPDKKVYYYINILIPLLCLAIIMLIVAIPLILVGQAIYSLIPIGLFIIIALLIGICCPCIYNNLYYAITTQRLIIRSGIIGIDFKSMDLAEINAVEVFVGVMDKMLKKGTGSLNFGSPTRPIVKLQNSDVSKTFSFERIAAPYDVSKEIKELIDKAKESKSSTKERVTENKKVAEENRANGVLEQMEQVQKLNELKESGAITQKEFEDLKKKILE